MDTESLMLVKDAESVYLSVQAVQIHTPLESQGAVDQIVQIKALAKKIEEHRLSMTRPLDESKKAIMDWFRPATDYLEKAEALLKASVNVFNTAERKKQAEADAKHRRLEALERDRQAEEQRKTEALLEQADKAAAMGDMETAEVLEAQAIVAQEVAAPMAVLVPYVPEKTQGASTRQNWKYRVVDAALVPREFLMVDEKKLGAYAKAMKADAAVLGVEFFPEDVLVVRS